jgi:hypothetical protein
MFLQLIDVLTYYQQQEVLSNIVSCQKELSSLNESMVANDESLHFEAVYNESKKIQEMNAAFQESDDNFIRDYIYWR